MAADQKTLPGLKGFTVTIVTVTGEATRTVDADRLTVGRAEDCNLVVAHETLSRRHLVLFRRGNDVFVEDQGSSNGSFVNGTPLKPHVPHKLTSSDTVTMGEATVQIRVGIPDALINLALAASVEPTPAATPRDVPVSAKASGPAVASSNVKASASPAAQPALADSSADAYRETATGVTNPGPHDHSAVDRVLIEAQRQATLILSKAEVDAEKKAQDILRRAHEVQSRADEQYQKRMNEAFRESEELSLKAQRESRELTETTRDRAAEMRTQAEAYVSELRERTKLECERALEDARRNAREMKQHALAEAADLERHRHEDLLIRAKREIEVMRADAERQMTEDGARRRTEIEKAIAAVTEDHQTLRTEIESLTEMKSNERAELSLIRADLALARAEVKDLEDRRATAVTDEARLSDEVRGLTATRTETELKIREAQGQLLGLNEDLTETAERLNRARLDVEVQLTEVRNKLTAERARLEAEEAALLQNAKLETTRRAQVFENQLMSELHFKREALAREIGLTVELFLKGKGFSIAADTAELGLELNQTFDRQIETLANDDSTARAQASLTSLQRRQKWKSGAVGATVGILSVLIGLSTHRVLTADLSPMQRRVAAAEEARQLDLRERKFTTTRSPGYKGSYFDNVLYTEAFTETYTNEVFQQRLMKELAPYMLRMWRLDESKVIEALSITSALVKSLDAMRGADAEALRRLRETLGSQVRLESFFKFEKAFYDGYQVQP